MATSGSGPPDVPACSHGSSMGQATDTTMTHLLEILPNYPIDDQLQWSTCNSLRHNHGIHHTSSPHHPSGQTSRYRPTILLNDTTTILPESYLLANSVIWIGTKGRSHKQTSAPITVRESPHDSQRCFCSEEQAKRLCLVDCERPNHRVAAHALPLARNKTPTQGALKPMDC